VIISLSNKKISLHLQYKSKSTIAYIKGFQFIFGYVNCYFMTSHIMENNKYSLKSIISDKLVNKEIKEICLLKDKHWKFGIKSQLKWFKNNVKKYDLHNLFHIKSRLVGYTLLRKRTFEIKSLNKKTQYLLFDTLVIDKNHRGMKLSNLLMNFNNTIIKQSGFSSFLICNDELVDFYKKNNWKILNKKFFSIADYDFSSNAMIFNESNIYKKFTFYINK